VARRSPLSKRRKARRQWKPRKWIYLSAKLPRTRRKLTKRARARRKRRRFPRALGFQSRLPTAVLSDADWQTILDAIGPLPKQAKPVQARRRLARCLRDYRSLRRDRATLHNLVRRWQRIGKLAHALNAALTDEWRHKRWRYNPLIDDALNEHLLPSTESIIDALAMLVRIRKGKLNPARDWLYLTLLDIWVDFLGGRLTASRTASGGPCVRFLRAAAARVVDAREVPSVVTARRIVRAVANGKSIGIFRATGAGPNQR